MQITVKFSSKGQDPSFKPEVSSGDPTFENLGNTYYMTQ